MSKFQTIFASGLFLLSTACTPKVQTPPTPPTAPTAAVSFPAPTTVPVLDSLTVPTKVKNPYPRGGSEATRREARAILKDLRILEQQGRSMEPLRNTDDLSKSGRCGELMRERQKRAKELAARAEALPTKLSYDLRVAATKLVWCVSCLGNALEDCDRARASLAQAEKVIGVK